MGSLLSIQIAVILVTAHAAGWLLRRLGQPAVIGEIAAGLVLGPLLLGRIAPELQAHLFGPHGLAGLKGIAELGLTLFIFVAGAELRLPTRAERHFGASATIGICSFFVPFLIGLPLGFALAEGLAPPGTAPWLFTLFFGCALAATALPVMARILIDSGMLETELGTISMLSAAVCDALTWTTLLIVTTLAAGRAGSLALLWPVLGVTLLIGTLFVVVRPWLRRIDSAHVVGPMLILLFASSQATESLGLHAAFGAFLFGCFIPRDNRAAFETIRKIEKVALLVLLPVFFAMAGLSVPLASSASMTFGVFAVILGAAILGKFGGAILGSRLGRQNWPTTFGVSALMNARGVVELVVIKIGLDLGLISGATFTMLLLMTLATTLMAGPLLALLSYVTIADPMARSSTGTSAASAKH